MINIPKQIWYVIKPRDDDNLAYMCQYEQTKSGDVASNVLKMQSTGRSWARIYTGETYLERIPVEGQEAIADNTPLTGFYVGNSVSRWSTSNKLFRVKDPRNFTVEIPTDNLATLLHHCTVIKGVVQEACVWGREGNNHILLPVNSEPYLITLDKMDTIQNKLISVKDLKPGDWVKFFEDDTEYYYVGKVKCEWELTPYTYSYLGRDYRTGRTQVHGIPVNVKDDKWEELFIRKCSYNDQYNKASASKPKIVEIIKQEPLDLQIEELSMWAPQRIYNRVDGQCEAKLIGIEWKEDKK